jgi:predicted  nucleic acid-binding Zn-ribbon protein
MIFEELNSEEFEDTLFKLEQPHLSDKASLTTIQKIYARHSAGLNSISQNLQESVEKDLADINKEAEHEVLQTKLDKIDALIDHRRSKLGKLDEDEDMKALTDKKKVKELEKDIKKLEVARKKVEKMMSKFKGKKKEVIDEVEDLDVNDSYVEDATERLDAGQDVDNIIDTYDNMGLDQKDDLEVYLDDIAPDDQKSDFVD